MSLAFACLAGMVKAPIASNAAGGWPAGLGCLADPRLQPARAPPDVHGCLGNTTVWIVGNSVQRKRYFAAAAAFNTSHANVTTLHEEKTLCGQGGAAAGKRPGQGSCFGPCTCGSRAPMLDLDLAFLWQQRVYDAPLRGILLGAAPVRGRYVRARDVVLLNAGLDDIATGSHGRDSWSRTQQTEAHALALLLEEAERRMGLRVLWLSTTDACDAFLGRTRSELSQAIRSSNGIIARALAARGVPMLDLTYLDAPLSGCDTWGGEEAAAGCKSGDASQMAAAARVTLGVTLPPGGSKRTCACERAYQDHVHPTLWHAQLQLGYALRVACGLSASAVRSVEPARG